MATCSEGTAPSHGRQRAGQADGPATGFVLTHGEYKGVIRPDSGGQDLSSPPEKWEGCRVVSVSIFRGPPGQRAEAGSKGRRSQWDHEDVKQRLRDHRRAMGHERKDRLEHMVSLHVYEPWSHRHNVSRGAGPGSQHGVTSGTRLK